MNKIVLSTALLSSLLFAGGDIAPVEAPVVEEVSSWEFEFSPYLAMSSISGDSAVISENISAVELGFDDIVDALEFGVAGHFEALHSSNWGAFIDYNYVSLGGTGEIPLAPGVVLQEVDIKQSVFEAQGFYRQALESGSFDYMAGIRYWNLKLNATLNQPDMHSTKNDWVDFVVGARWIHDLSENWKFYVSGDVGAGGSDFTASAVAGVRYTFNEWLDLDIQYKGLWVDYETGTVNTLDYFKYDTVTYGPMLGLNFKF
jgi:hypothetical protein